MKQYYIHTNAQLNGEHELHHEYCIYLPKEQNRICVGSFESCQEAIRAAEKYYDSVDGCKTCTRECHSR